MHRVAKADLVQLCSRSVASIADSALEVLVAGQQLKLETPEMADIVYNVSRPPPPLLRVCFERASQTPPLL